MTDQEHTAPTPEQMQDGGAVVNAGAQAATAEKDPSKRKAAATEAIQASAEEKGFKLSKEDAEMLAGMVVAQVAETVKSIPGQVVDGIQERGGFDKPPEPVSPPAAPTGSGTLPEQPAAPAQDEQPRQRSSGLGAFARRFRSGGG